MTRLLRLALLGGLLLALAACDQGPASNTTYLHPAGSWTFLVTATRSGPLLVELRGRPYDEPAALVAHELLAQMGQAIHRREGLQFTDQAAQAGNPAFRVVLTFNDRTAGSRDQCLGRTEGGGPAADRRVDLTATFCREEQVLANVRGWVLKTTGLEDRRFRALIRQVTRELFATTPDH